MILNYQVMFIKNKYDKLFGIKLYTKYSNVCLNGNNRYVK